MPYVDVTDIQQHFFQSGALSLAQITELMGEEEYYVRTQLDLDTLPDNNPTLRSIIRDLTIARCMLTLVPIEGETAHANFLRSEALRRLKELDRSGLGPNTGTIGRDPSKEVYNPEPVPWWNYEDFNA